MRFLLVLTFVAASAWGFEGLPALNASLTVVVDASQPIPPIALQEMRRELDALLKGAERRVDWRLREDMRLGDDAPDLLVVRFRGSCQIDAPPALLDERGPLAFTYTNEGGVLPFSEILCDKVKAAALSAMRGDQFSQGDRLMGRALARVLAHEIWHIVSQQREHPKQGVARHALSGAQLIADGLEFDRTSRDELRLKTAR